MSMSMPMPMPTARTDILYVQLGQRVYELEEAIDELQAREQDLNNDLQSADSAFENAKVHYENLVTALKEARRGLQGERDDALLQVRREVDGRKEDKESWQRAEERHKRALADRDQVCDFSN